MKEQLITEIQQQMLPYLNNEQLNKLRYALEFCFHNIEVAKSEESQKIEQTDLVSAFIAAKRI